MISWNIVDLFEFLWYNVFEAIRPPLFCASPAIGADGDE